MTGHVCPVCGTPRGADGRAGPGCDCAERAADAVRAERQAEIAAAEDFDPLRIRPYVTLQWMEEPETVALAMGPQPSPAAPASAPVVAQKPVGPVEPEPGPEPAPELEPAPEPAPELEPELADPPRRRRPFAGLIVGAAAVAVATTAAFAGLFSGEDERDSAIPDTETSPASVSAIPDAPSSSPSRSASPSASASVSRSPSATTSPSRTAPSASRPVAPSAPPPSTTRATGTVSQEPSKPAAPATLRRGDSGPEVVELQRRLAQIFAYGGPADGQYGQSVEDSVRWYQWNRDVQGDPEGVYGPQTRRALEAETSEP
jgi:hypothetical protein